MYFVLMNDSTEYFFVVAFMEKINRQSSGIEARYRELKLIIVKIIPTSDLHIIEHMVILSSSASREKIKTFYRFNFHLKSTNCCKQTMSEDYFQIKEDLN